MGEPSTRYFTVHERPYSSPQQPESLVRQHADSVPDAGEILGDAGTWRPTALLEEVALGLTHDEVVPIARDRAQALVDAWFAAGRLAARPADLSDAPADSP